VFAAPPVTPATVTVIDSTIYDTTPNLGTDQFISAKVYYSNGSAASGQYCSISTYRWSDNMSSFLPVAFSDTKPKCLEVDNALDNQNYDCYTYSDGAGEVYLHYYIDPGIFVLGDVGKTELHCGAATVNSNFTVQNYRESSFVFGELFQYVINDPGIIFGLFITMLTLTIIFLICFILPIIILKRLFA
jgi:hypothetical protein